MSATSLDWPKGTLTHIDSYDKLSPFGFCINGCIDGWGACVFTFSEKEVLGILSCLNTYILYRFSRRIMWLKVSTTNHDPAVILTYYLECVQKINGNLPAFLLYIVELEWAFYFLGCPTVVRLDCGTENGKVAAVQIAFRMSHGDSLSGQNSVRYGHSHSNVVGKQWSSIYFMVQDRCRLDCETTLDLWWCHFLGCCIENRRLVESVEETQDWVVDSHTEGLLHRVHTHSFSAVNFELHICFRK